jgi:LEA14-like dessication related protein
MRVLRDPVVLLEDVKVRAVSLSSLNLDVTIRVENENLLGITLKDLTFTVLCSSGSRDQELASGNTGRVKIAARGSTMLHIPVRSQNAALISALTTFMTKGEVQVTVRGTAIIDAVLFSWSVPFEKTLPVTTERIAGSLTGKGMQD